MEINKILEKIPDKQYKWKSTTSLKWKEDVFEFFKNKNLENVLEIGTNQGWTSYLFSFIAKNVYTIEYDSHNFQEAKKHCYGVNNISFIQGDAYNDKTYQTLPKYLDAVIIDCIHTYEAVIADINRALTYYNGKKIYIAFDDYGHPESTGVHQAINYAIDQGLKIESYIGQPKGYTVHRSNNTQFQFIHQEGIILSYEN